MTESHILQGPTQNRVTYEKNLQQIYVESKNLRHSHGNRQQVSALYWFGKIALGQAEQHSTLCIHMCSCLYSLLYNYLAPDWPQ